MSHEDRYIAGVPCWIDTEQPDPDAAVAFYGDLFGWEYEDVNPPEAPGKYYIARPDELRAGTGDLTGGGPADGGPAAAVAPGAAATMACVACGESFERPDMAACPHHGDAICSLCCSLEKACHDSCKRPALGGPVGLTLSPAETLRDK